jgi:hypothetical protein
VRNRTVGCKVTESEYEKLAALAEQEGRRLGEWARAVLLERADGRPPSVAEESLLAEVLALRTALLNLFYRLAAGEAITAEAMQVIIARADGEKQKKARKRLKEMPDTQQPARGEP